MAIITAFTYVNSTWCKDKASEPEEKDNPHKTAEAIGKFATALIFFGGIITLFVLSGYGLNGVGPFAPLSFNTKVAILGVLGGVEVLTIVGFALKALGLGKKEEEEHV